MIARPGCRDVAVYICLGCERTICPECQPSPREADLICGDCFYADDPEDGAA